MSQKMIVEIDETGSVQITVKGVKGKSCKKVSEQIEKALGRTTSSVPTSEMNEKPLTIAANS